MAKRKDSNPQDRIRIEKSRVAAGNVPGRDIIETHQHFYSSLGGNSQAALPSTSVPPLPRNFQPRPDTLDSLVAAVRQEQGGHSQTIALTAVEGMGGIGKTVLAQALCRDERIRKAFPDGIIWQSIGQESGYKMESRLRAVRLALDGELHGAGSEQDLFREAIRDKAALLVIDDVWSIADIEPWLADATRARVLFTTRNASIANALGASQYQAELLGEQEAREVFALWAGKNPQELSSIAEEIIQECQGLALALAMTGASLRSKPQDQWHHTLKLLRNADLDRIKLDFAGYPHPNLFVAIQVSVNALEDADKKRYCALAVLLEEMPASPVIQQTLWGDDEEEAAEIADRLISLSLAQADGESIRLHDLQLDYVRNQFPDKKALSLIHGAVRLSSHVIARDPKQFASQVTGRLLAYREQQAIGEFINNVSRSSPTPWWQSRCPALEAPGGALIRVLAGHASVVTSVVLSADGKHALSGSDDMTLRLWDSYSGRQLRVFQGHTDTVTSVALSTDGKYALSGSDDMTLRLWDSYSGRELRLFRSHTGSITGVALSTEGKRAISGSDDHTLRLWDLESGRELRLFRGHSGNVTSVALSMDGKRALSSSDDHTLRLWDVDSGREERVFHGHTSGVRSIALSADGKHALSSSDDHTLRLWDVDSGRELCMLHGHAVSANSVALSANGKRALSVSDDMTLQLWDLDDKRELHLFQGHTHWIRSVALSADGKRALSGSDDRTLRLWDVDSERALRLFQGHTDWVRSMALSGDGKRALSGSDDMTLRLWDVDSATQLQVFGGDTLRITSVALSADGKRALSGSDSWILRLWDIDSGRELRSFHGHTDRIRSVAWSADGKHALSGSDDKTLRLWDLDSGRELKAFHGHISRIRSVALSADGKRALSGSDDHTLRLWDVDNGRELHVFVGHTSIVRSVAWSADGKRALSSSDDKTLRLWEVDSGRELHVFYGHTSNVRSIAWSADGKHALSGSDDNTLRLWDVERRMERAVFYCDGAVMCCMFLPGMGVIAGDAQGRVHFLKLVSERGEANGKIEAPKNQVSVAGMVPVMTMGKKHVFLSYCRDNKKEVQQVRADLIAGGEAVWWDKDIHPGQDWKFEVRQAMKNAYAILLCLSKNLRPGTALEFIPKPWMLSISIANMLLAAFS